jgi:hypothetical protein
MIFTTDQDKLHCRQFMLLVNVNEQHVYTQK